MGLYFDKEIDTLAEHGVNREDLTNEELVELVHVTDELANPFDQVNIDAIGFPIPVCDGVVFWRLSVGACVWLEEYARVWWDDRPKAYFWALVYALIHGRERGAFDAMLDEESAFERIKAEAIRLAVHEDELSAKVDDAIHFRHHPAGVRDPREIPTGTDWQKIVARVESQTGISGDEWCWKKSADYVLSVWCDLRFFAENYGGSGMKAQRMKSELDHVTNKVARLRAAIVQRVKGGAS